MRLVQSGLRTRRANQPDITPPITSFSYCLCFNSHGPQPESRKVSVSIFPVIVRKSVTVKSNAVKRRNGKETGGRRLALRASLRPPVSTLAGWLASKQFSQTQDSDLQELALYSELSIDDVTVKAATKVQQLLPPDLRTRREVVVDYRIIGPGDRTSELPTSTPAV
jgi:hypothetical protein